MGVAASTFAVGQPEGTCSQKNSSCDLLNDSLVITSRSSQAHVVLSDPLELCLKARLRVKKNVERFLFIVSLIVVFFNMDVTSISESE